MARPRILFTWEMGDNFGHVSKIAETARALQGQAEMFAAVLNPIAMRQIAPDLPITLLAAPAAPPHGAIAPGDAGRSYPDVLRHMGWTKPAQLAALVEAWRNLFDLVRPDVLVSQASPTALLAARGLGFPVALTGSGFDAPPRAHPMPSFFHWDPKASAPPVEREGAVLATANEVLDRIRAPGLEHFCDLLRTDAYLLASFEEVDHYAPRAAIEPNHPPYLGQLFTGDQGGVLSWRPEAHRRIMGYLRADSHAFEATVRALARLDRDHDVILAVPGAPAGLHKTLEETPVRLHDGPVRLDRLLPECDLGISHASNGIVGGFMLAGLPQLALPNHAEQIMIAHTIARQKLGLGMVGKFGPNEVSKALDTLLNTAGFRQQAGRTAKRLRQTYIDAPSAAVARGILALV